MGLSKVVAGGIAIAAKIVGTAATGGLAARVTHTMLVSSDDEGDPVSRKKFVRDAVVEYKRQKVRTADGGEASSRATVTFLSAVPVGLDDDIVLPDGTTGPILFVDAGVVNPATKKGFLTVAYLG